jgi:hypothetical protein
MAVQQGVVSFSPFTPSPPTSMGMPPPSSLVREVVARIKNK